MKKKWLSIAAALLSVIILVACTSEVVEDKAKDPEKDTIISISGDTVSKLGGCVLASQFAVGDDIIFRMNAVDAVTGQQLKDAKLQVHLSTGDVLDMEYGPHGDDFFWVTKYTVTDSSPKGKLDYYVTAQYGMTKAEYKPFNVAPSLLSIVDGDGTAPAAPPAPAEEEKEEVTAETGKIEQKFTLYGEDFTFKNEAGDQTFYVKAGEEVEIELVSKDVPHGFDIVGLDVSLTKDGVVKFTPEKAGEYDIACNVFCGADHHLMVSKLVVVE